jgi:predicted transcriptional regulator
MEFHHQKVSTSMNLEDFLRILYPQQDKYRIAAACLLKSIAKNDNGLDGYELSKLCKEKSISRATMQKVFVSLRDLGIVDRRSMKYYLNSEFSSAARRLGDAWRNLEKNKSFDFNENTLKTNF